jgi:aromatic ring-opening dioxygenase catalytic subunit (LigB family)
MLGEVRLLLVEVHRHQLEAHRRLLLKLQQDVEHGVAVLAAGQAHHHLVAVLDHPVVGDGLADLAAQALGQLGALVRLLAGDGVLQREGHFGRRREAVGHFTPIHLWEGL